MPNPTNKDVLKTIGKMFTGLTDNVLNNVIETQEDISKKANYNHDKVEYITGLTESNTINTAAVFKDIYKQLDLSKKSLQKTSEDMQYIYEDMDKIHKEMEKKHMGTMDEIAQHEELNKEIDDKCTTINNSLLNNLGDKWNKANEKLTDFGDELISNIYSTGSKISEALGAVTDFIASYLGPLGTVLKGISGTINIGFTIVKGSLTTSIKALGGILKGFSGAVRGAFGFIGDKISLVKDFVFSSFSQMGSLLRISFEKLSNPIETIKNAMGGMLNLLFGGSLLKKLFKLILIGGIAAFGFKKLYENNPAFQKLVDNVTSKAKVFLFGEDGKTGIIYGKTGKGGVAGAIKGAFGKMWGWFMTSMFGQTVKKGEKPKILGRDGKGWWASITGGFTKLWDWFMNGMFGQKVKDGEGPKVREGKGWWSSILSGFSSLWDWFMTSMFGQKVKKGGTPVIGGRDGKGWWTSIVKSMSKVWDWFMIKLFGKEIKDGQAPSKQDIEKGGWWKSIIGGVEKSWGWLMNKMFGTEELEGKNKGKRTGGWWEEKIKPTLKNLSSNINKILFGNGKEGEGSTKGVWGENIEPKLQELGSTIQMSLVGADGKSGSWNDTIKPMLTKFLVGVDMKGHRGVLWNLKNWFSGYENDWDKSSKPLSFWERIWTWIGGTEGFIKKLKPILLALAIANPAMALRMGVNVAKSKGGRGAAGVMLLLGDKGMANVIDGFNEDGLAGGIAGIVKTIKETDSKVRPAGVAGALLAGSAFGWKGALVGLSVYLAWKGANAVTEYFDGNIKLEEAKKQLENTERITKDLEFNLFEDKKGLEKEGVAKVISDMLSKSDESGQIDGRDFEQATQKLSEHLSTLSVQDRFDKVTKVGHLLSAKDKVLESRIESEVAKIRIETARDDIDDETKETNIKKIRDGIDSLRLEQLRVAEKKKKFQKLKDSLGDDRFGKVIFASEDVLNIKRKMLETINAPFFQYIQPLGVSGQFGDTARVYYEELDDMLHGNKSLSSISMRGMITRFKYLTEEAQKHYADIPTKGKIVGSDITGTEMLSAEKIKGTPDGRTVDDNELLRIAKDNNLLDRLGPKNQLKNMEYYGWITSVKDIVGGHVSRSDDSREALAQVWKHWFTEKTASATPILSKLESDMSLLDSALLSQREAAKPLREGGFVEIHDKEVLISDLESQKGQLWIEKFAKAAMEKLSLIFTKDEVQKKLNSAYTSADRQPLKIKLDTTGKDITTDDKNVVVVALRELVVNQKNLIKQKMKETTGKEDIIKVNKAIAESVVATQQQAQTTEDALVATVNNLAEGASNNQKKYRPSFKNSDMRGTGMVTEIGDNW